MIAARWSNQATVGTWHCGVKLHLAEGLLKKKKKKKSELAGGGTDRTGRSGAS